MALVAALGFGTLAVLGKLSVQAGLSPFTALPWRFGLVALLLAFSGRGLTWPDRLRMLGVGLLYCVATHSYFLALTRISAGTTSLLLYLAPAFVVLYLWLLRRPPGRLQLLAVLLTVLGLGLVVGLPGQADHSASGLAFAALAGALYGGYLLLSERLLRPYSPLASTAHMALCACVYFTVYDAFSGQLGVPRGLAQWGVVAGLTVFPTLVSVPLLYAAIARIGAARASILATTEPLWTVLLALLLLHEPLHLSMIGGGALLLIGAVLAQRSERSSVVAAPLEL
ncbi:DMT family transporter [Deinococcus sonorensis]|uniref:DMT family transporter n=2 Tax=Deinococcus sonorensis TaxID=309891 RepID=A0AAU7UGD5_9DEIO